MNQEATPLRSSRQLSLNERVASIPVTFYTEILNLRAKTPRSIRFWSLCNRILAHMTATLDPHNAGLTAVLALCTPPQNELPVRSLQMVMGRKTPSRNEDSHHIPIYFLGAESLTGYATSSGHLVSSQNHDEYYYSGTDLGKEGSAVSCPIESGNRIAGCLNVSSILPNFFQPAHLDLIVAYTHLLALALDEEMFYEVERIRLVIMPPQEVQAIAFAPFRKRVMQLMRETRRLKQPFAMVQAETLVRQQLEEEMIQQVLLTHRTNS